MEDRIAALVGGELDRVPSQLRPFMEKAGKDDPDQKVMMTLGYMAYAYGRAFEEFATEAVKEWPKKDYIAQPICYLARHSMELRLKWAVGAYQDYLGGQTTKTDHHNLMKLWNTLTKLLSDAGAPADDEYTTYILKLLNHINEMDSDGEQFRYPHAKDGQVFELAKIELEGLLKAYWHISRYAEGSVEMLSELGDEDS